MWILVPSLGLPSVPATADSTSPSDSLCQALERSCSLRGKHTSASYWRAAWKKASWLRRLCGRISEPSTAARGVAAWIGSLPVTPVSRSASPESGSLRPTPGISGPTSPGSSASPDPATSGSRTSPTTSTSDSSRYGPSYAEWATGLRLDCSRRLRSALRTFASGSTPSPHWPTPTPWEQNESIESWTARREREKAKGRNGNGFGVPLDMAVRLWPTPSVPNGGRTTNTTNYREDGSKRQRDLAAVVKMFPTPTRRDKETVKKVMRGATSGPGGTPLVLAAMGLDGHGRQMSPTPSANDWKGSAKDGQRRGQITDPAMGIIPAGGQLNPTWVEWLMGLPLEWTALRPVGTEWSRWSELMRGALSTVTSSPAVTQRDLFDEEVA